MNPTDNTTQPVNTANILWENSQIDGVTVGHLTHGNAKYHVSIKHPNHEQSCVKEWLTSQDPEMISTIAKEKMFQSFPLTIEEGTGTNPENKVVELHVTPEGVTTSSGGRPGVFKRIVLPILLSAAGVLVGAFGVLGAQKIMRMRKQRKDAQLQAPAQQAPSQLTIEPKAKSLVRNRSRSRARTNRFEPVSPRVTRRRSAPPIVRSQADSVDWEKVYRTLGRGLAPQNTSVLPEREAGNYRIVFEGGQPINLEGATSSAPVQRDHDWNLMGEVATVQSLADEYDSGAVKAGLDMLGTQGYEYRPIKGDGHCFFRGVATGLLNKLVQFGEQEWKDLIASLKPYLVPEYADHLNLSEFVQILSTLATDPSKEMIEFLMNDPKTSDALVMFLRRAACLRNHNLSGEERELLKVYVENQGYDTIDAYLNEMSSKSVNGGEPEIHALSEVLGLNINIFDSKAIGKGQDSILEKQKQMTSSEKPAVSLLYRPGHYDYIV